MDVLAIAVAAAGLILASNGQVVGGALLSFAPLLGLAIGLARHGRIPTVLPFSFGSHFAVMLVCVAAAVIVANRIPVVATSLFAFWIYYYACIALSEKQIRYVPWATGFRWRTARAAERPRVFWAFVALFMGIAALIFGTAFASAAMSGRGAV